MATTLIPTYDTGATTKPIGLTVTTVERAVTDDMLREQLGSLGLNTAFVADMMSAALAHERCGTHLYRSVAGRTLNPELRAQYEHFGEETEQHVKILESLISAMGGDPQYVSPNARMTEAADGRILESTFLMSGSGDPALAEMCMLEAVLLAETIDHGNWTALAALTAELPAGDIQSEFQKAVEKVLGQEDEHVTWASDKRLELMTVMARADMAQPPDATPDDLARAVAGWFD